MGFFLLQEFLLVIALGGFHRSRCWSPYASSSPGLHASVSIWATEYIYLCIIICILCPNFALA